MDKCNILSGELLKAGFRHLAFLGRVGLLVLGVRTIDSWFTQPAEVAAFDESDSDFASTIHAMAHWFRLRFFSLSLGMYDGRVLFFFPMFAIVFFEV